jgi:LmbE family N-acetylglucosaminyl deacetylase
MPTVPPERAPPSTVEPHQARQVAESSGSDAERYDRSRPSYPGALVERIVAASRRDGGRCEQALIQARRVLAFSPHLDDAALSAGALLAGLADGGSDVHVVTLFAGLPQEAISPLARAFHDSCDLPHDATAVAARRREDLDAIHILGARAHHAELLDAVYRRRRDGEWLYDDGWALFDGMSPADDVMTEVRACVERFLDLLTPDLILTCAAVGGHADHLFTRTAVTAVAEPTEAGVMLWEDLPYAIGAGQPGHMGTPLPIRVSPADWERKRAAVARYASQTRILWPGYADWARTLKDHALSRGNGQLAEVLWDARASG